MSREDFEGIHEHAKKVHSERVAKTPSRLEYAIRQLEAAGLEYRICNPNIGHIQVWGKYNDHLYNFWAGTGKIQGFNQRGIHTLIEWATYNPAEHRVKKGDE